MSADIVIGLSAVIIAVRDGEGVVLTVRPHDAARAAASLAGLPFGPFDPDGRRTFELALRAFVTDQTGFELGYVEQLYTFGDKGRDAPLAAAGPSPSPSTPCSARRRPATPCRSSPGRHPRPRVAMSTASRF